jgi:glycosyltransferase involved in cell wall biosynthesis
MRISLCITVLNEERVVGRLLESVLNQTRKSDEIIVVDGGSTDKTVEIIRRFQKKNKSLKLLCERGSVAHGRNTAIEIAKNQIIAQIDAGCVAKGDWLEKLTAPFFQKAVDLVAGFYEMKTKTSLQEAMCVFHGVPQARFDPESFLPSARSVAFRKQLWEEVGGYDEKLAKAGEDTLFFFKCVKTGARIVRVEQARVVWEEPAEFTLIVSLKKFFAYAKGDAQAGIWWHPTQQLASHNIRISLIFLRYLMGIILIKYATILLPAYLFWSIWKWRDVVIDWQARLWLPVVQVTSDLAVMSGFLWGLIKK